jgi:hypothetical protein
MYACRVSGMVRVKVRVRVRFRVLEPLPLTDRVHACNVEAGLAVPTAEWTEGLLFQPLNGLKACCSNR